MDHYGHALPERSQSPPDYFAAPGLSNSGMDDLAVSPMRYWFLHINPGRPAEEPTPWMIFGSALHCAVLEPDQFKARYACELNQTDYPDALVTIEDMRRHLRDSGFQPKGTRKAEVIAQVQSLTPDQPIWDVLKDEHATAHDGKVFLSAEDWRRVNRASEALLSEPALESILKQCGVAEEPFFVTDPETGAPLKSRMDWVTPACTLDLKTFTVKRGKSIDRAVADAIWYERYYRTAYFYSLVRSLHDGRGLAGAQTGPEFSLAFVESDEPHEVRIRVLRPKTFGQVNVWWERARVECRAFINQYAECVARWGESPWRADQQIEPLADEDLPGLAY